MAEVEDADVETASEGYARRFAGEVGAWFLERQARATLELLAAWRGARVLDVGGGHGQLAVPLADAGYEVTVFGSPGACGERVRALLEAGRARFDAGPLLALPYGERRFDVVLAFRLLPHVARWDALLGELCRVAAQAVVIDYPSRRSVNAVSGALFGLKQGVEGNTRPFTVFSDAEIGRSLAARGFGRSTRRPQFLFPMAFHRLHGSARLGRALEGAGAGLTRAFGSPVILRAERG